jgi:hypothetical protein
MAAAVLGPLGAPVERLGDTLINRVVDEILGDNGSFRSTHVVIYNHSNQDLYYLTSSFDTGGFTPGLQPGVIEAGTVNGYKMESHGVGTGVTETDVRFGLNPSDSNWSLQILTTNPAAGDVSASVHYAGGLTATISCAVGNSNEVNVDVYAAS